MTVQSFTEEELQNLDKQTIIKLFLTTSAASQQMLEVSVKRTPFCFN